MNPRVIAVQYLSRHKLELKFSNGDVRIFDITPYLEYPVFKPLQEEKFCALAKVFNGTVAWDENIDLDPDTLFLESKPVDKVLMA